MTLALPWLFMARSNLLLGDFIWENATTQDSGETIEDFALQIGLYSHLNEYMRIYNYKRPRPLFDLEPLLSSIDNFKRLRKSQCAIRDQIS